MDKRFWGLDELSRHTAMNTDSQAYTVNQSNADIPACLDSDYCQSLPQAIPDDVLAMAFINMQPLESVYPNETAFSCGTLFPNLNKPFYGGMRR